MYLPEEQGTDVSGGRLTLTQPADSMPRTCWPMLAFCLYVWLSAIAKKQGDPTSSAHWKMRVLAAPSLLALLAPAKQDEMARRVRRNLGAFPPRAQGLEGRPRGLFLRLAVAASQPELEPMVRPKAVASGEDTGVFIYSPFLAREAKAKEVPKLYWSVGEHARCTLELANPFGFQLELEQLTLCTSDSRFHAHPQTLTLPCGAGRTCVSLGGVPHADGPLWVTGVALTVMSTAFEFAIGADGALLDAEPEAEPAAAEPAGIAVTVLPRLSVLNGAFTAGVRGPPLRTAGLLSGEQQALTLQLTNVGAEPVMALSISSHLQVRI
jgi:hypothetical protein